MSQWKHKISQNTHSGQRSLEDRLGTDAELVHSTHLITMCTKTICYNVTQSSSGWWCVWCWCCAHQQHPGQQHQQHPGFPLKTCSTSSSSTAQVVFVRQGCNYFFPNLHCENYISANCIKNCHQPNPPMWSQSPHSEHWWQYAQSKQALKKRGRRRKTSSGRWSPGDKCNQDQEKHLGDFMKCRPMIPCTGPSSDHLCTILTQASSPALTLCLQEKSGSFN